MFWQLVLQLMLQYRAPLQLQCGELVRKEHTVVVQNQPQRIHMHNLWGLWFMVWVYG